MFRVRSQKMMITIVRGGGQKVMIEIIISENDDNDGRPLNNKQNVCLCLSQLDTLIKIYYGFHLAFFDNFRSV